MSFSELYEDVCERIELAFSKAKSSPLSEQEKQLTFAILVKLRAHVMDTLNLANKNDANEQLLECDSLLNDIEESIDEKCQLSI